MNDKELIYALSPVAFAREKLGFEPDPTQASVLMGAGKRLILNCSRQWGKSTVTAAKAVHMAIYRPKSLTVVISESWPQSGEFVKKAKEFIETLGIRTRGDGINKVSLALPNGSRIVGLPGTEGTVRGYSAVSLLIVDEASRVSDGQIAAVTPMLAVSNGDMWVMSTPRGKHGYFYERWVRGGPQWRKVKVTAEECPRITPKHLQEELDWMGEAKFRREYFCEFMDIEESLFDRDMLMRAVKSEVKPLWPNSGTNH